MGSADTTRRPEPVNAPGRATITVEGRAGVMPAAERVHLMGRPLRRGPGENHNEDSFTIRTPCFCRNARRHGEAIYGGVSSIAVETTIGEGPAQPQTTPSRAPGGRPPTRPVIKGPRRGRRQTRHGLQPRRHSSMATAWLCRIRRIRVYLLRRHAGYALRAIASLRSRELVDAGQITADEDRVHLYQSRAPQDANPV